MARYEDAKGRTWYPTLTVRTAKKVRQEVQAGGKPFDLLDVTDGSVLTRLNADPVLIVETVWAMVQPIAEREGITWENFADAHTGDVILDAGAALVEALADFFPTLEAAQIRAAQKYVQEVRKKALADAEKSINALSGT